MTFEDPGAALRSEREKRGLTIDQVAEQLKINPRLLMALESGESEALPHPAYARGFIRSYAGFLGFDQEEIQNMLANLQPGEQRKQKVPPPATAQIPDLPPKQPRARGNAAWLALIVLCAICGGVWWAWDNGYLGILKRTQEKPADLLRTLPDADAYLAGRKAAKAPEPEKPEPVIAGLSRPSNPVASIPKPAPQPAPAEAAPAAEPEPEPLKPEISEPGPEPSESAAQESPPDQHKLVIVAIEECWVHSNADKTDTRQFSLRKGDTFALTFAKSLDLKLGNAGGVRLRYDGRDLPPPGTSGQVKTLVFPPKEE